MAERRRFALHQLRRVGQTPVAFSNWPRLYADLLRSQMGMGPAELTFKTRNGPVIRVPNAPGARVPAYEVLAEDSYELGWFLGDLMDRPIHVLDIGAHAGTFATHLTGLHPTAVLDCFEPSPDTAAYLRRNVEANGRADRVTVHEKALAATTGTAVFDLWGPGSGMNRLVQDADLAGRGQEVATISFGDVIAATGPADVVKMDCEGGEYDLVYASSPASWTSVQRVVLEYHGLARWPELRAWFAGQGLHVVRDQNGPNNGMAWLTRTPLADPVGRRGPRSKASIAAYELRRVLQTPRAFRNWPTLLSGLVRERVGRGPAELTFVTRTGQRLSAPNVPGARLPAYEQFAEDGYRLRAFLGELLDRPIHGLDVGAHVGTFACHFAEVHPTATLTCFEPSTETAAYLRRNLETNGLTGRVGVEEAALTGESGWALFDDQGDASVHSGLVHGERDTSGTVVKVRTLSFDEVVAQAPRPVEFIKLDCEGGEYQMAYRSSPDSWSTVQRVVLEYHDIPGESWADLRAWFAGVGLHLVRQESERANLGLAWLSRGPLT